jgi:exopolysaccharide biosynthesis WecB/TagA/CpsF family protein
VSSITTGALVHEVDDFDLEAFTAVAAGFGTGSYGFVVTPNVDHLIRCHDDPAFRELYSHAAYILMDSRFAATLVRLLHRVRLPVCTGSDLTARLLSQVARSDDRIVLIGGTQEQAAHVRELHGLTNLLHHNPPMGFIRDHAAVEACLSFIENAGPFRFCLLAVGSPQQERIARLLGTRGTARGLALCIGASINFITGHERRAPRWMQRLALEWLYRLGQDPRRLAGRYLVRGPRIFAHLLRARIVLRKATTATAT